MQGDWQQLVARQAAKRWDVPTTEVEIVIHERPAVSGVTLFAATNPDSRGVFKRYAPGIRRADGSLEWDEERARGEALTAAGLDGSAAVLAKVAALMLPDLPALPKLITDPERGTYYKTHYGIDGVAPPAVVEIDGQPAVDFWIKGDPVSHVRVVVHEDGRATVER